jgi:hypothetical protein
LVAVVVAVALVAVTVAALFLVQSHQLAVVKAEV